jgi:uncharacterized protein with HEPN domain
MKSDTVYLRHILEAVEKIEHYLSGITYESFCEDNMILDAVMKELEIIGEACSKLTRGFRTKHREIPYRDAIDMRNFLVHEYFGVRKDVVSDTCKNDLPSFKEAVRKVLAE